MTRQIAPSSVPSPLPLVATRGHTPSPVFAALDLGTNTCRLLIAVPTGGSFRTLDSFSRIVRLGEGLAWHGELSGAAMERAAAALRVCAQKLAQRGVERVAAVATEACRRASNGATFVARIAHETGLPLRIISPREEAELAMEACVPLLQPGDRRALLFDIGGGSTEIAWIRTPSAPGRRAALIGYLSLPYGVATLAERYGTACFTERGFCALVDDIAEALAAFDAIHRIGQEIRSGGVRMIGTSGTVTTLAGVAMALPRYRRLLVDGTTLDCRRADRALGDLFALGREGLARHPCIGPDRADFVLPGCAIYAAIRRIWPMPQLTVADRGLREGLLLRMMREGRWHRPGAVAVPGDGEGGGRLPRPRCGGATAAPAPAR